MINDEFIGAKTEDNTPSCKHISPLMTNPHDNNTKTLNALHITAQVQREKRRIISLPKSLQMAEQTDKNSKTL